MSISQYFKLKQQTDSCRRATLRREARRSRPNGFSINLIDLDQIKSHLPRYNFFQVNFTGLEETVDSSQRAEGEHKGGRVSKKNRLASKPEGTARWMSLRGYSTNIWVQTRENNLSWYRGAVASPQTSFEVRSSRIGRLGEQLKV